MRVWLLIFGLVLSSFFGGGKSFGMPSHDHAQMQMTQASAGCDHAAHHSTPKKPILPDDCCTGTGVCRMAGCTMAPAVSPPRLSLIIRDRQVFRPSTSLAMHGLAIPPPLGPPRHILS